MSNLEFKQKSYKLSITTYYMNLSRERKGVETNKNSVELNRNHNG